VSAPEPEAPRVGQIACDEVLFEHLVQLRKRLADERGVPPYIVFSDVALRQMARDYPGSQRDLSRISGMGEKKLREFGAVLLMEIATFLQTNPRQIFADTSFRAPAPASGRTQARTVAADAPYNGELFERLRQVRRQLAAERAVPAYIILHDSALRQMARECPANLQELTQIHNVGPKRAQDFGAEFLNAISQFLLQNGTVGRQKSEGRDPKAERRPNSETRGPNGKG